MASRHLTRICEDQGNPQRAIIQPVVVEIALVVVERLAMVRIDYDQRVIFDAQCLYDGKKVGDTRVHVRHRTIILGNDVILVPTVRREPTGKEITEGLKGHYRFQRVVLIVELICSIEDTLKRMGRQIGGVGIHVS